MFELKRYRYEFFYFLKLQFMYKLTSSIDKIGILVLLYLQIQGHRKNTLWRNA